MEGETYSAANGSTMKNQREKVVSMITRQGQWRNMRFQVCDVTRPLASVHKIVEASHSVTSSPSWDQRGSFLRHQEPGEEMWLTARDGVYVPETKAALLSKRVHTLSLAYVYGVAT